MRIDIKKIIRCFIIGFSFLCFSYAWGMETREAQQFFFLLGGMVLFGLILNNIWITFFLWWSVFLYGFFKFTIGHNYLINIFFGCLLYYLVKVSFKKEHIILFINAILWLIALNILYMGVQLSGLDWIFKQRIDTVEGFMGWQRHHTAAGFMGFKACMGMLMAFGIPLIASKPYKWAIPLSCVLFVPIWLSESSICILAGAMGLLFVLWYKISPFLKRRQKLAVYGLLCLLLMGSAIIYAFKVDSTPTSIDLRLVAWRGVLEDTVIHPVTGWGLDSFANVTEKKKHLYMLNPIKTPEGNVHMEFMDNPHNLYISLMFEWGIFGLIFLIGYLRQCRIWFMRAVKEPNTIALAGFGLVVIIVSIAQFPMFLARMVALIVPMAALFEIQCRET